MSDRGPNLPVALRAAKRIATRETRAPSADTFALAHSLHAQCTQVCGSVRQSMGDDGCSALMGRAFARTELGHPAVQTLRGPVDYEISLAAVTAAIQAHGGPATALAVDALLKSLHEILARLIGEEMATRVLDYDFQRSADDDDGPAS